MGAGGYKVKKILGLDFIGTIKEPIFVKNKLGLYVDCNLAFEGLIGIPRKKLIGSTAFDVAENLCAEIYTEQDKALFESKELQNCSANLTSLKGKKYKINFSKVLLYSKQDECSGFIGIITEILNDELGFTEASSQGSTSPRQTHLTPREIELLRLVAKGYATKEIARVLLISPHTVTHHLKAIYIKLGVNNKISALIGAAQLNFI